MRIAEIEKKLIDGECSEDMIDLFKAALKRVPEGSRCQHCYVTAAGMKICNSSQAISLIEYGLEQKGDSWSDYMRSYTNAAIIYERSGKYENALQSYQLALSSIDSTLREHYKAEYAVHMLRVEMHISGFTYTSELQKYYDESLSADTFRQSFKTYMFYKAVAEIIIFVKGKKWNNAEEALLTAKKMLNPDCIGPLTLLLKKHKYDEKCNATEKAKKYLKDIECEIKSNIC